MRMKVQLYVAGKTFYEYMEAVDYSHARQIALARNPGATVIGCNADFQSNNNSTQSNSSSSNVSHSVGTNSSGENSAGGLGGLIILGLLGMGLLGLFGDDETPKTKQYNNSQAPQVERTYTPPVQQSQTRGWTYQRPSSDNFFTNSGIQEEAIDDLGQTWDN
jgi:hypothetical protein